MAQRKHFSVMPSERQLASIPVAAIHEYELSEREVRQLRSHIYKINKDGIRRYRTLREDHYLMVWRLK